MRINPTLDEVVNGQRGMLRGIDIALEAQCLVSAVSLIFSSIDSLAALNRPINQSRTTRHDFLAWVDRYLQPEKTIGCSSLDIYSARCGVLHTYSSESDLTREGTAKQLIYQWQSGPNVDAKVAVPTNSSVMIIEALYNNFRESVQRFLIESEMDPEIKSRVSTHLPSMLCYTPWPTMSVTIAA